MSRPSVTITPMPEWGPGHARIEVAGHDISYAVQGVEVQLRPAYHPKVTLHLRVDVVQPTKFSAAEVVIPDATHEALIKLGWTPPAEDQTRGGA